MAGDWRSNCISLCAMSLSNVSLQQTQVYDAYHRANLFDKMKKRPPEEQAAESERGRTDILLQAEAPEAVLPDKPKPNTVPFKSGHTFQYGEEATGRITVTINEKAQVKVEVPGDDDAALARRKSIRSLVMLGLGKVGLEEFNTVLSQNQGLAESHRQELAAMGVKTDIPFGLGEKSYYFSGEESLREYKALDIKG